MQLKEFIPPLLYKLKTYARGYPSYKKAIAALKGEDYQNTDLCKVVAYKTAIYKETELVEAELSDADYFLLQVVQQCLQETGKKDIHILDYGGACGMHYFTLQKLLKTDARIYWHVIETPQMVAVAKEAGLQNEFLSFSDSIMAVDQVPDMVYSSCSLHYVESFIEALNEHINVKAKYLALNRMYFGIKNTEEVVFIQQSTLSQNGIGVGLPQGIEDRVVKYPCTLFPFNSLEKALTKQYNIRYVIHQPNDRPYLAGISVKKIAMLCELKQ